MFDIRIIRRMDPLACSTLFNFIIKNTIDSKGREHQSIIVLNDTKISDRSEYILRHSKENPLEQINHDIDSLHLTKASILSVAYNTSHFLYKKFKNYNDTKILNTPEATLKYCKKAGRKKAILPSTLGTINSKIFEKNNGCDAEVVYPNELEASQVHKIIYDIKGSSCIKFSKYTIAINSILNKILNKNFGY